MGGSHSVKVYSGDQMGWTVEAMTLDDRAGAPASRILVQITVPTSERMTDLEVIRFTTWPGEPGYDEARIAFHGGASELAELAAWVATNIRKVTYNSQTDRYELPDGTEDPYRRHLRQLEESSRT